MIHVSPIGDQIRDLIKDFGAMQNKQAPHAVRDTANALAIDIQHHVRLAMRPRFRMSSRGRAWADNQVRVLRVGSPLGRIHIPSGGGGKLRAYVGVIPSEGKGQHAGFSRYRGSLLAMLEGGGPTPGPRDFGGVIGLGRYAVPVRPADLRTPTPLSLYPINLKLQARRRISGGLLPAGLKGKRRTYLVPMESGRAMIFQRFGKERDATMPLFSTQNQTRLPARRYFFPTAQRVIETRTTYHFRAAMQQALFGRGAYRP
jgi:hypothetical protein